MPLASLLLLQRVYDPQTPVHGAPWFWFTVLKMLIVFTVIMVGVAMLTLAERKISAWIQDRHGPNRVGGKFGLLQPAADGLKNIMKEETYPEAAYKAIFILAPVMSFIPALMTFAVIPFAAPLPTPWGLVKMVVADAPIGFLYILAISSLGVYGIVLAGWSSNNKYSLLGGLRSSAQMVSYEVAMGLAAVTVLLLAGNVQLDEIVQNQIVGGWYIFPLLLGFFIFLVSAFAETNRLPFDLPEAESELIAGYHTEYSGMAFAMFFISEYSAMITQSALMATLFFGGWDIPFTMWDNVAPHTLLKTLVTFAFFWVKILAFVFVFIWVRWTLPRFRYDQLMALGWKFLLPLSLVYIVLIAAGTWVLEYAGIHPASWIFSVAMLGLNIVCMGIILGVIDRGRLISPAYSRLDERNIARLRSARYRVRLAPVTSEGGAD
jgi:NADH-quinone oxidoreductase subunit H